VGNPLSRLFVDFKNNSVPLGFFIIDLVKGTIPEPIFLLDKKVMAENSVPALNHFYFSREFDPGSG
jgi:hypothetical protein